MGCHQAMAAVVAEVAVVEVVANGPSDALDGEVCAHRAAHSHGVGAAQE